MRRPPAGRAISASALRHIGIYAYRVKSLLEFAGWPPTPLETTEKLEQLRALEHGMRIHVVALQEAPPAGVDTPEDLEAVRARLRRPLRRDAAGVRAIRRQAAGTCCAIEVSMVIPEVSASVTGVLPAISRSLRDCSSVSGFAKERRRSMWALRPSAAGV